MTRFVLGVDGGGSKTLAWVVPEDRDRNAEPTPVGVGVAGPSNVLALGLDTAAASIGEAVTLALQAANLEPDAISNACLAIAGAGREAERDALQQWARANVTTNTRVVNDAEPVLYAPFEHGVGVALIAGTGSLAVSRTRPGQPLSRRGGWGRLLGDEGSGYAIARAALQTIARAHDGRAPATRLLDAALQHFECDRFESLVSCVYAKSAEQLASFAPRVIATAADDATASEIVRAASGELALLVTSLVEKDSAEVDSGQPLPLALAGGLLANELGYRERTLSEIAERLESGIQPVVVAEPVAGAVRIAESLD